MSSHGDSVVLPSDVCEALVRIAGLEGIVITDGKVDAKSLEDVVRGLAGGTQQPPIDVAGAVPMKCGKAAYGFLYADGTIVQEPKNDPDLRILDRYHSEQQGLDARAFLPRIAVSVANVLRSADMQGGRFMIGKATCPKDPNNGRKGFLRGGMVNRFRKYADGGYRYMVCLAMFDGHAAREAHHYADPEYQALAMESALHQHFKKDKRFDEALSCAQSGMLTRRKPHQYYAVVYLALCPGAPIQTGA